MGMPVARRRRLRVGLVLGSAAAVVAVVTTALLVLTALEYRFGPIEPTDPGWKVQVVNDLNQTIHVKDSASEDLTIAAGRSDIFVSPSPGQRHVVLTVMDAKHRTLGCITVDLDRNRTLQAKASEMGSC